MTDSSESQYSGALSVRIHAQTVHMHVVQLVYGQGGCKLQAYVSHNHGMSSSVFICLMSTQSSFGTSGGIAQR